jgi:hypothetical protein
MAQILGILSRQFAAPPVNSEPAQPEIKPEPLVKYSFNVCAIDGSAFTMELLAPNADVATRFIRRYPGLVSFDPVRPEGQA